MWTKEKILNKIKNDSDEIISEFDNYIFSFIINKKPESYARERKGRGKHFYNPKEGIIKEYKEIMKKQLSKKEKLIVEDSFKKESYIELYCDFYIPIPKNDSIKTAAQKEMKMILPAKRPDLDNYEKLLLDALHDVIYNDDSKVIKISGSKFYSMDPRTELKVILKVKKEGK